MTETALAEKPKTNLFEIVAQAQSIEKMIAEAGGELTPELEAALDNIDLTMATKVESYSYLVDRVCHEAMFWKGKAQQFTKLARALESVADRVEGNMKKAMIAMQKTEVLGESVRYVLSTTKGALVVDTAKLPDTYKMAVTEYVADKEKIRAALEKFEDVPGAKLEGGYSLRKYANKRS